MKISYLAFACFILLSAACNSPVKEQHNNRLNKANTLQNNSAEATTDHENTISSGNLTDSTERTDTSGKH
jgi:hypothetical protein